MLIYGNISIYGRWLIIQALIFSFYNMNFV